MVVKATIVECFIILTSELEGDRRGEKNLPVRSENRLDKDEHSTVAAKNVWSRQHLGQ